MLKIFLKINYSIFIGTLPIIEAFKLLNIGTLFYYAKNVNQILEMAIAKLFLVITLFVFSSVTTFKTNLFTLSYFNSYIDFYKTAVIT